MKAEDWLAVPSRTKGREATTGVIPGRFALSVGHPALPTPPGWKWTKLSDVARLESGHTPSRKHPEYWDGDVPWIGIKDAVDNHGRTINNTYQHVTEFGLANSSARLLPKNTVCLSRTASIGYVTVMGRPMATSQDFVNWVCSDEIEPQFLKAILIAEHESLWRFASGTTHQTIYYPEVKAFHVCLPPIQEQRAIARILSSLDDKIELNQQMNGTLEAIARATFKSWFVDFDPVRAKMDGRQPAGMDAATADLFPDSFEDSPLGKIPKGWNTVPFEDLFLIPQRSGLTKPKQTRGLGTYMVNMRELFAYRRIGDLEMERVPLTQSEAEKNLLQTGDLLFARRSLTWEGAGQCSIIIEAKEPRTFEGSLIRCRLNSEKAVSWCYFYYFLSDEGRGRIESVIEQVAVAGIRSSDLAKLTVLAPSVKIQRCFGVLVEPLEKKMASNDTESRTLASIRDALLPKLLSGEIQVKEAERLVEAVA